MMIIIIHCLYWQISKVRYRNQIRTEKKWTGKSLFIGMTVKPDLIRNLSPLLVRISSSASPRAFLLTSSSYSDLLLKHFSSLSSLSTSFLSTSFLPTTSPGLTAMHCRLLCCSFLGDAHTYTLTHKFILCSYALPPCVKCASCYLAL